MLRRPPRLTLTDPHFPSPTLCRSALDLPCIEVHVTRDGAVSKIAGDRLPADARTPDAEGGAGDAILVDPGVGEERDLLLGHDDAIGDGFAHHRTIGEIGKGACRDRE